VYRFGTWRRPCELRFGTVGALGKIAVRVFQSPVLDHGPGIRLAGPTGSQPAIQGRGDPGAAPRGDGAAPSGNPSQAGLGRPPDPGSLGPPAASRTTGHRGATRRRHCLLPAAGMDPIGPEPSNPSAPRTGHDYGVAPPVVTDPSLSVPVTAQIGDSARILLEASLSLSVMVSRFRRFSVTGLEAMAATSRLTGAPYAAYERASPAMTGIWLRSRLAVLLINTHAPRRLPCHRKLVTCWRLTKPATARQSMTPSGFAVVSWSRAPSAPAPRSAPQPTCKSCGKCSILCP
jgi:hypothetical protein